MNSTLRHFTEEKLSELISVSRFRAPATAWIKEAHILNLYTGEWSKQNVVLFEDRIATWVKKSL